MLHAVREGIERREVEGLSRYAARAIDSAGRVRNEEPDPVRTCYQRDRDRILHSKSFRRLKHKTQVFIDPTGDHYRTRLTHSLEVAQVARTIGRALRLNEDLVEAIALGHDVGHTPFGHAGESALDAAVRAFWDRAGDPATDQMSLPITDEAPGPPKRFRHYEQSLRVVDVLEGLNLTQETRAGIGGHSKGRADLTAHDGQPTSTLEAAVVRISDRIAYLNHDLDDAMRSGIIEAIPSPFQIGASSHGARIGAMVQDVIEHSIDRPAVSMSAELQVLMNELKEWLFENVYLEYPKRYSDIGKAQGIVRDLFEHYLQPRALPEGYRGLQGAVDYVAGMTDRFAIDDFAHRTLPRAWNP